MTPQPPRLQPALLGGALIGVLSALPIVSWLNMCCCLWVVLGGAMALWIAQSNHAYPVTAADGALTGLLAGLFGGLVAIPLTILFEPIQRNLILRMLDSSQAEIPPQIRSMLENSGGHGLIAQIVTGLFMTAIYAVIAMLGGLLGVALFKKKDVPPPPGTVEVLPPDGGTSF
jgi:hypothetical protein